MLHCTALIRHACCFSRSLSRFPLARRRNTSRFVENVVIPFHLVSSRRVVSSSRTVYYGPPPACWRHKQSAQVERSGLIRLGDTFLSTCAILPFCTTLIRSVQTLNFQLHVVTSLECSFGQTKKRKKKKISKYNRHRLDAFPNSCCPARSVRLVTLKTPDMTVYRSACMPSHALK